MGKVEGVLAAFAGLLWLVALWGAVQSEPVAVVEEDQAHRAMYGGERSWMADPLWWNLGSSVLLLFMAMLLDWLVPFLLRSFHGEP